MITESNRTASIPCAAVQTGWPEVAHVTTSVAYHALNLTRTGAKANMRERLSYRTHTIDLELMEIRPQRFRWIYLIDGTHLKAGTDVLQPEAIARSDALVIAHGAINALELIALTAKQEVPMRPIQNAAMSHGALPRGAVEPVVDRSEEARRRAASRHPYGGGSV